MTRNLIAFRADSVSDLAKSLRAQLASRDRPPSHVEMLNMLARATGHRNFQHYRAQAERDEPSAETQDPAAPADEALVLRAAGYFDAEGRLKQWPARTNLQTLCMWGIWAAVAGERDYHEREINEMLAALHLFGDAAILRRTLCALGLMTRTIDGTVYRRVERAPSPEGAALIRRLGRRTRRAARGTARRA